jgi:hypothetical protein
MKNLRKNSKGFMSLSFTFVLMTFLSLYLTGAFAIALSQQRDYIRSTCVNEASEIQSSALKNMRQLFTLNATSTSLRLAIKVTQAQLALAVATMQLEMIPLLETQLNTLYQSQKTLNTVQQTLITKAKVELHARHVALIAQLNSGQKKLALSWQFMITMSSYFTARSTPTLAIRADSEGGIGPNYEWQEDAERKQTLAYGWNMFFETKRTYQKFISWFNVLSLTCTVSPNLGEQQWQLKINADK